MPRSNPVADRIAQQRLELDKQKAARASAHMDAGEGQGAAGLRIRAAQLDQGERRFQAANALAVASAEARKTADTYNNTLKYYQTTKLIADQQMATRQLADAADFQKGYSMIDKFDPNRSNKIAKLHAALPYAKLDEGVRGMVGADDDELKQLRGQGALPSAATTLKSIAEGTISKDDIPKLIGPDGEIDHSKASLLAAERMGEASGKPQTARAKQADKDADWLLKYQAARTNALGAEDPNMKAMFDITSKRHLDYLQSQNPEAVTPDVPPVDAGSFVPRKPTSTVSPAASPITTPAPDGGTASPPAAATPVPATAALRARAISEQPAPVAAPAVAPSAIPPASTPKEQQVSDWANDRDAQSL